jgi:hypothetical protein
MIGVRAHVFPEALVPMLRERLAAKVGALAEIPDDLLVELLMTVFFAGLETHEGVYTPLRVVFLGQSEADLVIPEGAEASTAPIYALKLLRFESARPFTIPELVKLGVASTDERLYAATSVLDGKLALIGLAREGPSAEADPFIKIVATRPGSMSVRSGRSWHIEYERGTIVTGGEDVVMAEGPVRVVLESSARDAGMEDDSVIGYLDAVRALVGKLQAHGRGGILVFSHEEAPAVARTSSYRMARDSSITSMLRLAHRVGRRDDATSYGFLLRTAFLTEVERMVEEFGALTAIDGATVLTRGLALAAFGVVLPVRARAIAIAGAEARPVDLEVRGTRHRASALYAADHPGSVVFVASEDGQVTCMLRDEDADRVVVWHLA